MRTAVLITAGPNEFDPTVEIHGMTSIEWLSRTLFMAGANRIAVAGTDTKMKDVREKCKKLIVDFVFNSPKSPNYMVNGLRYIETKAERIVIIPSSCLFIDKRTITTLLESTRETCVAVCDGVRSEIIAVNTNLLDAVIENEGDLSDLYNQAYEIEFDDTVALSDVSVPGTDLEALYSKAELHTTLRPVAKISLGYEDSFFGPGTEQLITLVREKKSINKAIELLGMSYFNFMKIRRRMEGALGYSVFNQIGGETTNSEISIAPEALELNEKYRQFCKKCNSAIQEIFDEFFGDGIGGQNER
jgi:molybdenum-dependent DNA-binding transcriptional regulator ModE